MSRENEFDESFKKRMNQMEFEFQDSYWTEMEALMEDKKKKRGPLFWWLSGVGVTSMLIASTLFFLDRDSNQHVHNKGTENVQTSGLSTSSDLPKKETQTTSDKPITNGDGNQVNFAIPGPTTNLKHLIQANNPTQPSKIQKNTNPNHSITNPKAETGNSTTQNTAKEQQTEQQSSSLSTLTNDNKTSIDNYAIEPMKSISAGKLALEEANLAALPTDAPKGRSWFSHVGILVETSFAQSLNTDEGKVGGLGSNWGLRFYYAHKKGFMLNTGLSFGVNSIDGLKYEEMKKIYGFTQYDVVNTIYYKRMLTANIPMFIGYEGQKFAVSGGLRLNYIMNTKGVVHTWDHKIENQNIWGYAHGIKHFNISCGMEFSYQFARRWDLGGHFDFDLSSRSEENNNLISPEARLWQTGLFVKYRLN